MNDAKLTTLAQVKEFLAGTAGVRFHHALWLCHAWAVDRGPLLRYTERMTRLVKRYQGSSQKTENNRTLSWLQRS